MNKTKFVEVNGDADPNLELVTSNSLQDLVDVYGHFDSEAKHVIGYVKVKNKYGFNKFIPATYLDDAKKEHLICQYVY